MKLLIVLNPQIDFCEGGALEIEGAGELLEQLSKLATEFDQVICIKESHPANHVSFAANHPWRYPGQTINFQGKELQLTITHCVQGQFGSMFHSNVKEIIFDQVINFGQQEYIETDREIRELFDRLPADFFSKNKFTYIQIAGLVHNNMAESLKNLIQSSFSKIEVVDDLILKYKAPVRT